MREEGCPATTQHAARMSMGETIARRRARRQQSREGDFGEDAYDDVAEDVKQTLSAVPTSASTVRPGAFFAAVKFPAANRFSMVVPYGCAGRLTVLFGGVRQMRSSLMGSMDSVLLRVRGLEV